jgi:signal transduction histidine kinase
MTLEPGAGLPGRVWVAGQPAWIEDVLNDSNFPRAPFARTAGIHGAFAFSIDVGGGTIGIIECYHGMVLSPDLDLMRTMTAVGEQIGAFVGRRRIETLRAIAEREREDLLLRELAARREAEAANRAKDEFLAMLSHELRTPLNAIVGWTRMLLDGAVEERNVRKALAVIDRNAQLQTQLVADILDVSRIVTGNLQLNCRPCDLGAVIAAALDAVRPAAAAKQIELQSTITAAPWYHGDPERLQQVVWNLLSNAVKFTPDGGTVTVALSRPTSGITRLTVTDTGLGIELSFLPYVFDRFRQADGSIARQHGGLGLGLAIVRHIVELHGGTVSATSDGPGAGAMFTVELPSLTHGDPAGRSAPERT